MKAKAVNNISLAKSVQLKLADYSMLAKARLNFFVVFSAAVGYILAAGPALNFFNLLIVAIGGFLVTASSNTINQVLEKDFDAIMERTKNRPLPAKRMQTSEAILFAGITAIGGLFLMWYYLNGMAAFFAALSLIAYAFVYTPLKRISPIAVFVGAIPGALPPMIGWLAFSPQMTIEPILLFGIQFLWQFPHFWAIGWVGYEDYKKAGYNLLPSNGGRNKLTAMQCIIYIAVLFPLIMLGTWFGIGYRITYLMSIVAGLIFIIPAFKLYKNCDRKSALKLMFASFIYLPLIQISLLIDRFWI